MTRLGWRLGMAAVPFICSACTAFSPGSDKADAGHDHDDRYYTEGEVDSSLAPKADVLHDHDGRYYTEGEVDSALVGKAAVTHTHDGIYPTRAEVDAAIASAAPRAYVASMGVGFIGLNTEANAVQYLIKGSPLPGKYIARVDAELNTFGTLYFIFSCKLQFRPYPSFIGTPFSDLPGTRRTVNWRLGREESGPGVPVSISMQAPVTAGTGGVDVRMVCWGTVDGLPITYNYGVGIESAVLVLEWFSSVN